MMTSAQVVETSVNVTSNSPSQDYTHPDDHNLPNYNFNTAVCRSSFFKHDRLAMIHQIVAGNSPIMTCQWSQISDGNMWITLEFTEQSNLLINSKK